MNVELCFVSRGSSSFLTMIEECLFGKMTEILNISITKTPRLSEAIHFSSLHMNISYKYTVKIYVRILFQQVTIFTYSVLTRVNTIRKKGWLR